MIPRTLTQPLAMRHEFLPLSARQEWDSVLPRVPHAHAHTWNHVAAFQASTGDPTFLYVGRDLAGEPLVVCPIAERRMNDSVDAYTPFGFGGFAARGELPGFAAQWQSVAESRHWTTSYVALNPLLAHDLGFPASVVHPLHTIFVWDVRRSPDALLASMASGRRRQLRKWEAAPRSLTRSRAEVLTFLKGNAAEFFRLRAAGSAYFFAPRTWERLLHSDSVHPIGITEGGRVLAAIVFGLVGPIAEAMFGISRPGFRTMLAPLIWEGVKGLKAHGAEIVNLGSDVRGDDGVALFKRQFGSQARTTHSLRIVHDEDHYASLCRMLGVGPEQRGGFFPPYCRGGAG